VASAGEDKSIALWDIASGQRIRTLTAHTKTVWSINFSQEGTVLASGSADQTVRIWDAYRARNLTPAPPEAAAPAADEVDAEGKRKRREISSPELLQTFSTKQTPVFHTHFTPRNLLLAAGAFSSSIQGTPALQ
jgi:transcription initiation factor TFIID subunit 5